MNNSEFYTPLQFKDRSFIPHYDTYVQPRLQAVAAVQRKKRKQLIWLLILAFPFLLIGTAGLPMFIQGSPGSGFIFFLLMAAGAVLIMFGIKRYKTAMHDQVPYSDIFQYFGQDYEYHTSANMDAEQIQNKFHLFPIWDDSEVSDMVVGSFKDIPFELCQLILKKEEHSSGSSHIGGSSFRSMKSSSSSHRIEFKGLCLRILLNTGSTSHILIQDKSAAAQLKQQEGMIAVHSDQPCFNRSFKAWTVDETKKTTDKNNSLNLPPDTIDRICALKKMNQVKEISLAVKDTEMLVLLTPKNAGMFSSGPLLKQMDLVWECNNILRNMEAVLMATQLIE